MYRFYKKLLDIAYMSGIWKLYCITFDLVIWHAAKSKSLTLDEMKLLVQHRLLQTKRRRTCGLMHLFYLQYHAYMARCYPRLVHIQNCIQVDKNGNVKQAYLQNACAIGADREQVRSRKD